MCLGHGSRLRGRGEKRRKKNTGVSHMFIATCLGLDCLPTTDEAEEKDWGDGDMARGVSEQGQVRTWCPKSGSGAHYARRKRYYDPSRPQKKRAARGIEAVMIPFDPATATSTSLKVIHISVSLHHPSPVWQLIGAAEMLANHNQAYSTSLRGTLRFRILPHTLQALASDPFRR